MKDGETQASAAMSEVVSVKAAYKEEQEGRVTAHNLMHTITLRLVPTPGLFCARPS